MPFPYKPLFLLEADAFFLVEIERLDTASTDPGERYHWLRFEKDRAAPERLDFVSMAAEGPEQHREFRQGTLRFNAHTGSYRAAGAEVAVPLRIATPPLPPAFHDALVVRFTGL